MDFPQRVLLEDAYNALEDAGIDPSSLQKQPVGIFIGSEGGISEEEAAAAVEAGIWRVWLGRRILRCETAPTAALALLMYLTGNM